MNQGVQKTPRHLLAENLTTGGGGGGGGGGHVMVQNID